MFIFLYILKLCLKTLVSKGNCKPISEMLGNGDNGNISESRECSSGSAQRQTYSFIFITRKTKERKINELCSTQKFKLRTTE